MTTHKLFKSICFSGYGPFAGEMQFDFGSDVTLIVGRNNSGKSCLVDLLCSVLGSDSVRRGAPEPEMVEYLFEATKADLTRAGSTLLGFRNTEQIPASVLEKATGQVLPVRLVGREDYEVGTGLDRSFFPARYDTNWNNAAVAIGHGFAEHRRNLRVRRLFADRNIVPGVEDGNYAGLGSDGQDASLLVQHVLTYENLDESIIEDELLGELNRIMQPDARFTRISVQNIKGDYNQEWEIFLQEEGGRRFPLSSTGSGLKTVLLVLLNLLVADDGRRAKDQAVFFFEELENNLHPSLQRRLFEYLYGHAVEHGHRMVLTSHSQVAINVLFGKGGASIYHVTRSAGGTAALHKVDSDVEAKETLDDLGIKASDLFQTNGIIWVEGPSDRIYIKAWLEALYPGEFAEGSDYQFLYYGGKLLFHYTASEVAEKINFLYVNRNAAVIIDSDKKDGQADVNATKKRVRKELNEHGLMCWITQGKEIENYLSSRVIGAAFGPKAPVEQVDRFEPFPEYISACEPRFTSKKVDFAKRVAACILPEDAGVLNLRSKMEELHDALRKWASGL